MTRNYLIFALTFIRRYPGLRTMNETTASIAGTEVSKSQDDIVLKN
jgi:hypothetical protein